MKNVNLGKSVTLVIFSILILTLLKDIVMNGSNLN